MAELKREYNVPLRREWLKVPKHKRAKKAVKALKQFLVRHMKSDDIRLGQHLNEEIWKNGMRNPPHHVKISTIKDAEGIVRAELEGKPMFELKVKEEKKEKSAMEQKLEKVVGKKKEVKPSGKKLAKEKAAEKKAEKAAEKKVEAEPTKEASTTKPAEPKKTEPSEKPPAE